jgi:hypothetical protein
MKIDQSLKGNPKTRANNPKIMIKEEANQSIKKKRKARKEKRKEIKMTKTKAKIKIKVIVIVIIFQLEHYL